MDMLGNRVQFKLLTEAERATLSEIGKKNLVYNDGHNWVTAGSNSQFVGDSVYRIELQIGKWYRIETAVCDYLYKCSRIEDDKIWSDKRKDMQSGRIEKGGEMFFQFCSIKKLRLANDAEISDVEPAEVAPKSEVISIEWVDGVYAKIVGWEEIGCSISEINLVPVGGHVGDGWILSGYEYADGTMRSHPMTFLHGRTMITERAVKALFVRGDNN